MALNSVLTYAHALLKQAVGPGETVVDATVVNGHDTIFLATLVGPSGRVLGFDIQKEALKATETQLVLTGQTRQVTLINDGHEHLKNHLTADQQIGGAIFNLGYLPGGDKQLTTQSKTTLEAVKQAINLLRRGGLVVVVVYPGHPAGRLEQDALLTAVKALDQQTYNVLQYAFINQIHEPPFLLAVERK